MIEITELNIYPVKSLKGIALDSATLGVKGLAFDRNWMVIDSNHHFLTQRQIPKMATVSVKLTNDFLVLEHPSTQPLVIDLRKRTSNQLEVKVWKDQCLAFDEGLDASAWLTKVLGQWRGENLKLCRFSDDITRSVPQMHLKGEISYTAFSDEFPFLITSEESLKRLNENLGVNGASGITMQPFRPNIVIRGVQPFEEDTFDILSSAQGRYKLGMRKPCQRCPIVTTDQATGERPEPKEPLLTLIQMKTQPNLKGAYFGQNSTLLQGVGNSIAVGDKLIAEKI